VGEAMSHIVPIQRRKKATTEELRELLKLVEENIDPTLVPVITLIGQMQKDPFRVLIATVLSLRTKDAVTAVASKRLFDKAPDVYSLSELSVPEIEKLIYPVGFYKTKAKNIAKICR
jgi:endonuclease III